MDTQPILLDSYLESPDIADMMDLVVNDVVSRSRMMVDSVCEDPAWSLEDVLAHLRLEFLRVVPLVREPDGLKNRRGYRYRFYYSCVLNELRRLYNKSKRANVRRGESIEALWERYGDLLVGVAEDGALEHLDELGSLRLLLDGLLDRLFLAERVLSSHGLLLEYRAQLAGLDEVGSDEANQDQAGLFEVSV